MSKRAADQRPEGESPGKQKDSSKPRAEQPELVFEDPFEDSFESESMGEGSEHESEEDGVTAMQEEDEEKPEDTEVTSLKLIT